MRLDSGSLAGAFLCRLSVVTTALFLIVCQQFAINCDRRSNFRGVGHFGGQICKFGAPCKRCTNAQCQKRAQEMHLEYKNVTSFRGLRPL